MGDVPRRVNGQGGQAAKAIAENDCAVPGTWFQVPKHALPILAKLAKSCSAVPAVFLWLRRERRQETGETAFSHQEIYQELQLDKSAVSRAVALLEDAKLIKVTARGGVNFGKHKVTFPMPEGLFSPMQLDPKPVAPMQPAFSPEQPCSHACNSLRSKTPLKTKYKTTSSSSPPQTKLSKGKQWTKEEEEVLGFLKGKLNDGTPERLVGEGLTLSDAKHIHAAVLDEPQKNVRTRRGLFCHRLQERLNSIARFGWTPLSAAEPPCNAFGFNLEDTFKLAAESAQRAPRPANVQSTTPAVQIVDHDSTWASNAKRTIAESRLRQGGKG